MSFRAGEVVGPYHVLQTIGRGSFGVVLLASDSRTNLQTALKIVPCDHLDAEAAERARETALAEAGLLRRLRHPHVVACLEMCWDAERHVVWLALDYMDGGDLQAIIGARRRSGEAPIEAQFVRRVLAAIGSALQYIHAEGVLHRDVKPSNVLLSHGASHIKLADFGISKLLDVSHRNAQTIIGTPYYMAPEMVRGQPYNATSDAWAFGICLYEMVTLTRPFEAANQLALARQIVDSPLPELPPDIAPDLANAIIGLLEKEPLRRMPLEKVLFLSRAIESLLPPRGDEQGMLRMSSFSNVGDDLCVEHLSHTSPEPIVPPVATVTHKMASPPDSPRRGVEMNQTSPRRQQAFGSPEDEKTSRSLKDKSRSWFSFRWPGRAPKEVPQATTTISAFSAPDGDDGDRGKAASSKRHQSPHGSLKGKLPAVAAVARVVETVAVQDLDVGLPKLAIITGGSKGIGFEVARACVNEGFRVVITSPDEAEGRHAAHELGCESFQLALDSKVSILACAREVEQRHGWIDVLVNSAQIVYHHGDPTPWTKKTRITVSTNYFGTLMVCEAFFPLLREGGRVVTVTGGLGEHGILTSEELRHEFASADSTLSVQRLSQLMSQFIADVEANRSSASAPLPSWSHVARGWPNHAYNMSMLGLVALTKIHARELVPRSISVNCCCPWGFTTDVAAPEDRSQVQGADTASWLVTRPTVVATGQFFRDRTPVPVLW